MRRFVVIATMRRGAVMPSEPLDDAGQWLASLAAEAAEVENRKVVRFNTKHVQRERDPALTPRELAHFSRPPVEERLDVERMIKLARVVG